MLLRITHVTGGTTPAHPIASTETLHACLATADKSSQTQTQGGTSQTEGSSAAVSLDETAGEILSAGRRSCTITVDDKCVSRRHACVRLISRIEVGSRSLRGAEFGRPETREEADACDGSETGIVCVLRDCGSKFGTFVEVDEESGGKFAKSKGRGNEDDAGDETDDGAADVGSYVDLTEKQAEAVRMLGRDTDALPKFRKMEANSSKILLPLSRSSNANKSSRMTILFGPQGSAIHIRLVPLRFTFSRLSSNDQSLLLSRLPAIGATHAPQWDKKSTHLITKESKATAKHIMAWASMKPAVTQDWVLALLTRRDCRDAMPREEDYVPPGHSQLNEPLSEPCKALKGYRIAVLLEDDSAPLAESAGADVIKVYEESPPDEEFESWWRGQCARANQDRMALVVMETTSRKATSRMKALSSLGCRFTNQKNLAKAITAKDGDERLLVDVEKRVIEKVEGWEEEREEMVVEWGNGVEGEVLEEEVGKVEEEKDDDATDDGEDAQEMVSTRRSKRTQEDVQEEPEQANEKVTQETQPQSKRRKDNDDELPKEPEPEKVVPPTRQKRSREEKPQDTSDNEEEAVPAKKTAKSKTAKETTKTKAKPSKESSEKVINDEESCDESIPDERIPLSVTEDGWFIAAPASRKNYRKKLDDAEADGEERPRQAAKTARVSGLIVREYVQPAPRTAGRRNGNKKDFKRFRKNLVIRGFTSFGRNASAPKIRLVSVLPKESERQRQLEIQQLELERDEERADALFNEGGGGGRGGRGRSSGSIAGFLTQSSTKRGRSRR